MYNDLVGAMETEEEEAIVRETVESLATYTRYHFRTEEALMRRAGYDEEAFVSHCREHQAFTDQIAAFQDRLFDGSLGMSAELADSMGVWLTTHIQDTDPGYVTDIREAGIG